MVRFWQVPYKGYFKQPCLQLPPLPKLLRLNWCIIVPNVFSNCLLKNEFHYIMKTWWGIFNKINDCWKYRKLHGTSEISQGDVSNISLVSRVIQELSWSHSPQNTSSAFLILITIKYLPFIRVIVMNDKIHLLNIMENLK